MFAGVERSRLSRLRRGGAFVGACLSALLFAASPAFSAERLALLIGCSVYKNDAAIAPLPGAENDVARLKSLLRERLQFDEQQIEVLAGWPEDDESRRPTKANIERAFVALTDRVSAGSSVFIFLSGHGDQRPVSPSQTDLLDPKNVEPDSLDEVFIAADYAGDDKFIRDDQIGRWLDDLTNKGAHVWIVFDACHSATLTRDGGSPDETPRRLAASRSTVEEAAFAAAVQRAESLPEALRDPFAPPVESLTRPRAQGSVTAFYACQPFETAKELYRPRGAERTAANRRGLFSFHLEEALRAGLPRTLTYRELSHQLVARLRADLGGHAPTPYFDGDLDREVLGFASWPAPAIRLEPAIASDPAEQRRVSGGTLHGVAPEAILAVYAPNDREYQREIARARVLSVAPTSAIVEPWPGAATSPEADATARAALPSEGTCRIVERGWSEPKLRIAVAGRTREPSEAADALAPVVERLRGSLGEVVEFVNDDADSIDFTLAKLTPDVNRVGSAQAGERLRLTPGRFDPHAASVDSTTATYPALEPTALASCVEKDLQKILTWRRFWRLVEATGDATIETESQGKSRADSETLTSGARTPVRLEVHSTNAAGRRTLGGTSTVFPGDVIEASLCNSSLEPYHYSVFYLSSNYAIEHVRSQSVAGRSPLEAFREIPVDRMKVADKRPVFGAQGYIVVATPQRQPRPELEFLDQSPLGVFTQTRATLAERPRSAFARFLLDAAKGKPATRGPSETTAPSLFSPVVSAASWTVARPPTKLE